MHVLTNEQSIDYVRRNFGLDQQFASPLDFVAAIPFEGMASIKYTVPIDSGQKVALGNALFWQLKPRKEVLLWLRNWMVAPSSSLSDL